MNKVQWPDFTLPPVNLWNLPPADWFYRFRKEAETRNTCRQSDLHRVHSKHAEIYGQRQS